MVNARRECGFRVELAGHARGGVAVLDAELAAGAVAIGVDRRLRHAQLAGDLLRGKVLVDKAQAFTLTQREQAYRVFRTVVPSAHA
jgi:hypothetical protein